MGISADVISGPRFVRDGLLSVAPYMRFCTLVILVHLGIKAASWPRHPLSCL